MRRTRSTALAAVLATATLTLTPVAAAAAAPSGLAADEAAAQTPDAVDEQTPEGVDPDGLEPVLGPTGTTTDAAGRAIAAATGQPIVLTGRGNGHGIGLGQYGTRGQAMAGRTALQILAHYYKGTSVTTHGAGFRPRIGVVLDEKKVRLVVRGGQARITYNGTTTTSTGGQAWDVLVTNSGKQCWIDLPGGGGVGFAAVDGQPCLTADPIADDATSRIDVLEQDGTGWDRYGAYGRKAVVEVVADDHSSGSTNWLVDVVVETPMDQYLYGLAEMPYSWENAALRAQAIAGRSYAMWRLEQVGPNPDRGCACHLYDSQQDQVFDGWDREQSWQWGRWKAAVDATSGQVVHAPGQIGTQDGIVQAFYSSSSNGRTEAKHELWGGSRYPYLVSVDDHWTLDPATGNPYRSWTKEVARTTMAASVGLDFLTGVEVAARSSSGATTQLLFRGLDGGSETTRTATGSWARSTYGLRSTTFEPTGGNLFADISGSPHAADIAWLAISGITTGCNRAATLFCPNGTVTRGQMAAFITRAYSLPPGTRVFDDTRGHLFQDDVAALARAGITSGCGGGDFCVDDPVTRAETAAFIARAENYPLGGATIFTDARTHLHTRAIEAIRRAGVTYGCNPPHNTRFCPNANVTRAEMASLLRRALDG